MENQQVVPPQIVKDGLSILYSPENAIADVVFVHGLQGDPRKTWSCKRSPAYPKGSGKGPGDRSGGRTLIKNIIPLRFRSNSKNREVNAPTTNDDEEAFWPLDFLPGDCENARILTFGYESKAAGFFSETANQGNINSHSRNLLHALKRRRLGINGRGIIFVAHSLGGIIVKDTICHAAEDEDLAIRDIFSSTKGVVFLGTPHRGSRKASIGEIARRIAAAGSDTVDHSIDALQVNSAELERIHQGFVKLYLLNDRQFEVKTFKESGGLLGTSVFGLNERIVEPFSSTLIEVSEHIETINAHHMVMCQFGSRDDEGYQKVAGELRVLMARIQNGLAVESNRPALRTKVDPSVTSYETSSSQKSLNEVERKCISLLMQNTANAAEYRASLPVRIEGTCQWVLSSPQYKDWDLEKGTCLLWITGYPGSGKTILSTFLLDYLSEGLPSPTWQKSVRTPAYFFCDEKIKSQRDGTAVLRSLIHQLILQRHRALRYLKAAYDIQGPNFDQNFNELWKVFVAITSDPKVAPVKVIVDAIDECEATTRERLLNCIFSLVEKSKSSKDGHTPTIKFLVTSRPLPGFQYNHNQLMIDPSQPSVEDDLRLVIQARIDGIAKRTQCKPEARRYLENALYSKADRTFLWVTLVLYLLEKTYLASRSHFESIVDELPQDLTATYERFLLKIPYNYRPTATRLLHFVVGSARPLNLEEIRMLLAVSDHHRCLADVEADAEPNIQDTIQGILGPLVRIWDSRIHLVHQSLKEFLVELARQPDNPLSHTFGINLERAKLLLCQSSVAYLMLDDFKKDLFASDTTKNVPSPTSPYGTIEESLSFELPWDPYTIGEDFFHDPAVFEEEVCKNLEAKYSLLSYAAIHWAQQYAVCETAVRSAFREVVRTLSDTRTLPGSNWFRYYWVRSELELNRPTDFSPFLIASFFGHLEALDSSYSKDSEGKERNSEAGGLFWAARNGHERAVDRLLKESVNADLEVVEGQTALVAAAQFNRANVVERLLQDKGFNTGDVTGRVNHTTHRGRTALSIAAACGYVETVRHLLDHPNIEPDIPDYDQWTPIFWAVSGKHLDVVQMLVTHSMALVNHIDRTGRNVLSWAAEDGELDIVKYLISLNNPTAEQADRNGRTAMSWAAGNGKLEVVEYLRRSGRFDASSRDNNGRNAISWACSGKHHKVLEYLIRHDRAGVDRGDADGWTPLAWALFQDAPKTVKLLLASGLVDVNKADLNGSTPLGFAVGYGYLSIVKMFLEVDGIKVSHRHIATAKAYGHTDIVHALEEAIKQLEK